MAEERIWIQKIEPECKFRAMHETTAGGHSWIDYLCCNPSIIHTNRKCDDKRLEKCKHKELYGLSRQEAIGRMAKAICASNMAPDCLWKCETCDRWKGSDKEAAEAALNALLESVTNCNQ